jgi:Transposase DDE domain group 1
MPTQCSRDLFGFAPVEGRRVEAAFDGGDATSDAGALLLGATDRAIGLVARFAACFDDGRVQGQVEHAIETMVAQRMFGIALGYEDLVDHDQLRHDPVLATLAGKLQARRKDCAPLAGKSTLNRLEHAPVGPSRYHKIGHDGAAIERLFVDLFLAAHKAPPRQIVLDLDATDDPLHGHQEGRFFHGYYDCHCYLPLYVFCGSQLLAAKLRRSNIDASAGAVEEVARIVTQVRTRWPRVEILLRADSGFAREALMSWCEANGVDYVFGLARNERLIGAIADDRPVAEAESLAQGGPARRFADFAWRTLDSWSRERRVVAKAEHLPKGGEPALRGHVARGQRDRRPHPLRGHLLRPRPGREPDVWMPPALQAGFPLRSGMRGRLLLCIRPRWATCPRASMSSASGLPIIKASSRLFGSHGLCHSRSDRLCHRVEDHPRSRGRSRQ